MGYKSKLIFTDGRPITSMSVFTAGHPQKGDIIIMPEEETFSRSYIVYQILHNVVKDMSLNKIGFIRRLRLHYVLVENIILLKPIDVDVEKLL